MTIDFPTVVPKFDAILARGLSAGLGVRDGQMCIEAAICAALDLPHGDKPSCVEPAVRTYKIALNDSAWSSTRARAAGLRDLGIAQIGSARIVAGRVFARRLAEQTIRVLIPQLFRSVLSHDTKCISAAQHCEDEGSASASTAAASTASAAAASSRRKPTAA